MNGLARMEHARGLGLYGNRELVLVRGENAIVWDSERRTYVDCVAGHGSASLGHANPAVAGAVRRQAERLVACSNAFCNDVRARFMERLSALAPPGLGRVFLCNSGTEAVEAALKFAMLATGRKRFVSARGGFHGRTMGALSATHNPAYREGFGPLIEGFGFVPYNDPGALEKAVDAGTAGVILEVVQGEGGVHVGTCEFLRRAQDICRERGALFILDEVQTGFCRTGRTFALEHHGLRPDMVCLAKSIAGGLPMGAVLCPSGLEVPPGKHGTTFGGNPLSCAAGLAALDFMAGNDLAAQAERKGLWLREKLTAIPSRRVREVRGLGLMVGIELRERSRPFLGRLEAEGVLALPAGPNVIRLLPPLTIEQNDLDHVVRALRTVLEA